MNKVSEKIQIKLKRCANCKELLDINCFKKDKRSKDGLFYYCTKCISICKKQEAEKSPVPFNSKYIKKLIKYGYDVRENCGMLELKCKFCEKWFEPTYSQVKHRLSAIYGNNSLGTENNLYCSDKCKHQCPLYHSKSDPNEKLIKIKRINVKWFRDMVLEKDEYTCQICGSVDNLNAHHIIPFAENYLLELDIDNTITLCDNCHYNVVHKQNGCTLGELKNKESLLCLKKSMK